MKKIFFLFFLLDAINIFAQDDNDVVVKYSNNDYPLFEILTYKPISEIVNSNIMGSLVDVYYPKEILNFYVFVFKDGQTIYRIAANTENRNEIIILGKTNLDKYIAIGYYAIDFQDGTKVPMFKSENINTPFDFLNDINPESYVSILEIERMGNIMFDHIDKGGFIEPFYTYACILGDMVLFIKGSPADDKKHSFFMGIWSYKSR
jgi:hypothetical protein